MKNLKILSFVLFLMNCQLKENTNQDQSVTRDSDSDNITFIINLKVNDLKHLDQLMLSLKLEENIYKIKRC